MLYLWLKAAHVAAVLIFIGGLVSQSLGVAAGARSGETLAIVSLWDRRVTTPAMPVVWLTGALVAASGDWFSSPWLMVKLVFVVALSGLHGIQSGRLRRLRRGATVPAPARPLLVPGAVAASVAVIALLAVLKPW